jgi:hypothetical protein
VATITNATTGGLITTIPMVWISGNYYACNWTITPLTNLGFYNVSITATDGSAATNAATSPDETLEITLGVIIVGITFDSAVTLGWIGDTSISLNITVSSNTDIDISDITLIFGAGGMYDSYFTFNSLSEPYAIAVSAGVPKSIEIIYDIDGLAPQIMIDEWYINVTYTDPLMNVDNEYLAVSGMPNIELFGIPTLDLLDWVYVDGTGTIQALTDGQSIPNSGAIRFYIDGTTGAGIDRYINLTMFGFTETNFLLIPADIGVDGHDYAVELNVPTYLASNVLIDFTLVNATFIRTVPGLGSRSATLTVSNTDSLIIDSEDPYISDLGDMIDEIPIVIDLAVNGSYTIAIANASIADDGIGLLSYVQMRIATTGGISTEQYLVNNGTHWLLVVDSALIESFTDLKYGRTLVYGIRFADLFNNPSVPMSYIDLPIQTEFVDYWTPVILGIEINGELVGEDNTIDIAPNQYTSITVYVNELGQSSSMMRISTVYYTTDIAGDGEDYTAWSTLELKGVGNDEYYKIFPNDQIALVGFPQGTELHVVIVFEDYAGNQVVSDEIVISVGEVGAEMVMASQILMSVAGAIIVGSILYRFLRRKKMKVIDRG